MSQTQAILDYLKKGNTITSWECIHKFRCTRLSARIYDLRDQGYNIITNNITENGKTFAEYTLLSSTLLKEKN